MRLLSSFLALTLSTSAVLAADAGRLSPGHPAGVKRAQQEDNTRLYVLGGAAILAGIAVAISNHDNGAPPASNGTVTASTGTSV